MIRRVSLLAALLAVALVAAACGGGSQQSGTTTPSSSTSTSTSSSGNVQRIEVSVSDFRFDPQTITVERGTPVEIVLTNSGTVVHDFNVDGLNVSSGKIAAGQSATVRFTPAQAGEFRFACLESGHDLLGMVGTLTVQ